MELKDICCDTHGLMSVELALEKLLGIAQVVCETEKVLLEDCVGRILAVDVTSTLDVPPHDNSAMDGYALRSADLEHSDTLTLVGQSFAGHPFDGEISPGQCVRIMTGATIADGADAVIMQERTEAHGDQIHFSVRPPVGSCIRKRGEDIAEGDVILTKGHKINAADIGLLASLGIANVEVSRKIKVAVFSTGDELKTPGQQLGYGDIYESNRFTVSAMLKNLGVEIIDYGIIFDDKDKITAIFEQANKEADIVVSSGGVSVGDADHTKEVLEEQGTIGFWKLAIKPGKPFAFGKLSDSFFVGLPGNPVSAMVTFHQLAVPFMRKVMGQNDYGNHRFKVTCDSKIKKRPGRTDFQRGVFKVENGVPSVTTTGGQGSGILRSMSQANCYIILEQEQGDVQAGEQVCVELFDGLIASS